MAGCEGQEGGWRAFLKKELTWKKELIPIKAIQFLYSAGTNALFAYLTLHMQQLGITIKEIGTIYTFLPITSILGPPISGILADKFGNFKLVVLVSLVLTVVFHVMLLYIPQRPTNSLTMSCGPQGHTLSWSFCHGCHMDSDNIDLQVTLQDCELHCESPSSDLVMCLHDTNSSDLCTSFDLKHQITLNGTLTSWMDEDMCGHTWHDLQYESEMFHNLTCPGQCPVECQVKGVPPCHLPDDPSQSYSTFWIYFILLMIANFFMSSLFTMMDALTLAIVKQHNGDYGKQRFLFIVGMAVISPLTGLLIDWHEEKVGYMDKMPAFYLGAGLCLMSALLITRLQFSVDRASEHFIQDLKQLVIRPEINMYLVMILLMGSNWGFIESYLFIYLGSLGASNSLMGLTMTVGSLVGLPVMFVADRVVEKLHRPVIFIISFFTYTIRHIGYSYINDPWLVLPFELLEVFTYQLMWVAAITYCPILAPKGLLATITALIGTIHFSLGAHLIANLDLPTAFRVYGGISVTCGALYSLLHFFYLKKKIQAREKELKEEERRRGAGEGRPMLDDQTVPSPVIVGKNTADSVLRKCSIS
ncbi:major facilitator superfamily domain-containing protein 6-like isoform X2 [Homarus americanus]|uniref:major facilitator superfamily domain-containing protein 6-like isoform X2 n=1 Tax=Homarus americanus TaxID=6706 RepID=UPI001C43DB82|nr:major facilitator superfamily domain-containing protein 6-like isoform X2 [Homarus americanus]